MKAIRNSRDIIHRNPGRSWRIALLSLLFNVQFTVFNGVWAQEIEDGEAFYVYRNDGDFNAFFYDQVIRMGYSKFDLDSVEYDVYVVQEIETEDSLYRIPLSAIDSIGFQQPEIRFNPKVKFIDGSPLLKYITNVHTYRLTLQRDTPEEYIPKSGDILLSFDEEMFDVDEYRRQDYAGFCMKVSEIFIKDKEILVDMGRVTCLGEIFDQFITAEQVYVDEENNTRRRMAGYNSFRRAKEGYEKKPLFEYSGSIKRELSLPYDAGTLSLEAGLDCKVILQMAYNISSERLFVKTSLDTNIDVTPKVTVKSSSSFDVVVDGVPKFLKSIKFPAVCPLFQTRPLPDLYVRGGGDLALTASLAPVSFKWKQTFTFDTDQFPIASYRSFLTEPDEEEKEEKEQEAIDKPGDVAISLSGFIQAGVRFGANIETNDWLERIFSSSVGVDLFIGPKIEGQLEFSKAAFEKDGAYGLFKDNYLKFHGLSLDLEAKAKVCFLWSDPEETTFFELTKQFLTHEMYLLPDFKTTVAKYDTDLGWLDVEVFPSRHLIWPTYIGTGVYNYKGERVLNDLRTEAYFFDIPNVRYNTSFRDSKLPCGTYTAYPYVLLAGVELPVKSAQTSFYIAPLLRIGETGRIDSVQVSCDAHTEEIPFATNTENMKITIEGMEGNWLKASFSDYDGKKQYCSLHLELAENLSPFPRQCDVIVSATEGKYTTRDTLRVQQNYGVEGFKAMYIKISAQGNGTSQNSGVKEDGTPYNNSSEYNSTEITCQIPVSTHRDGNLIVCEGKIEDPKDAQQETKYDYGLYKWEEVGYSLYEVHLVIDTKSRDIIMGNAVYDYSLNYESWYHMEYGSRTDHKEKITIQKTNRTVSWTEKVPGAESIGYGITWDDKTVTGQCAFRGSLDQPGVSGSWSDSLYGKDSEYKHYTKESDQHMNVDLESYGTSTIQGTITSASFGILLGF